MNIILLGAPGAGKGTQAVLLSEALSLPHISTGEHFRRIKLERTELGLIAHSFISKGQLVPDDIVIRIVSQRLSEPDCGNGFILDGFPRTLPQAAELKKLRKIDICINIDIDTELLIARITGRRVCSKCGKNFHVDIFDGKDCSSCGGELIRRDDDYEETVRKRLKVYLESTKPLIDFYRYEGILVNVQGGQTVERVFEDIKAVIGNNQ